jgi:ribosomal protein L7/L12
MKNNMKINAIKAFRMETGLPLKEAKKWIESYMAAHNLL